jgi:hypothetical protein
MGAVTPKFKFGFVLREGDPNVRLFSEGSTQAFNKGDPVSLASGKLTQFTTPSTTGATSKISVGIIGIAADDASGTANTKIPVYVISPEQVWEVHSKKGVKPSTKATYDEGKNVKINYLASTAYTLSDGDSNTITTDVGAWYASSSAASAGGGVIIMEYRRGEEGTKGGRMLVRFASHAADGRY